MKEILRISGFKVKFPMVDLLIADGEDFKTIE
jgi:hypothetical protein